jgi:DNA repair exonuclease SbcCD ATPase subunit
MRIIHIADVHWRGLSRHEEYILAFKDFFKKAKALNPDIIYIGGDIVHSKTQGISPELIQCLAWWFNEMAKVAPTHVILGNHDGLILNKDRQDAVSPIIKALNNPNIYLYKNSGNYEISGHPGFYWNVFSCFDEEGWNKVSPIPDNVNIALYHGAAYGSLTDTDWQLEGEISKGIFKGFDFALLGDIHKRQFLNEEKTVAYCGSTIQQNYGETIDKGFLCWDIRGKGDFDVEFHSVQPVHPFYTVEWLGSVEETLDYCENLPRQSKIRVRADNFISQSDTRRLRKLLKKSLNAAEVVYKIDSKFDAEHVVDETNKNAINLRNPDTHKDLLRNYYSSQNFTKDEWQKIDNLVDKYVDQIGGAEDGRNIKWTIDNIGFDNAFSYGKDNYINFKSLPGITGIFGRNARGKSSIIGTIAYALFNTSDRGSIKNLHLINTRYNNCKAEIDITINGIPHRIIRQTVKKVTKKNVWAPTTLKFYRLDKYGEIVEDLTDEQRRETEKIVRSKIGTAEEFMMTSLASQGEMNTFVKEKAAARKLHLSNFLDLGVFDKLYDLVKKDSNETRARANALSGENWQQKIDKSQARIDDYLKKKAFKELDVSENKKRIKELNKAYHKKDTADLIDPKTIKEMQNQLIQIDNQSRKLSQLKDEAEDSISGKEEKIKKIKDFLATIDIDEINEKREAKIKIEKNLAEIQGLYNLEKRELEIIEKSVKKLSEVPCGDRFPSCKFIKESHKNKKKLDTQEKKVTLLSVKIDDISETFKVYSNDNLDEKISKYNKLLRRKSELITDVSDVRIKISQYTQNIERLADQYEDKHSEFINLREKFELQEVDDEVAELLKLIKKEERSLKENENNLTSIIQQLANHKANVKLFQKQKDEYDKANGELKMYDVFAQAVSRRGIPVQIIHSLLPKINAEIAKILNGVVGFVVELEADLDSNAMDIYINYGDSRRIIELGSGMEKMMASLAIRVALINCSTLPKTNMLMIDEGFGALDETNLEACGKLLQSLKKWFKNILIISHIDAIKDVVDNTIEIMKNGVDSRVYQE